MYFLSSISLHAHTQAHMPVLTSYLETSQPFDSTLELRSLPWLLFLILVKTQNITFTIITISSVQSRSTKYLHYSEKDLQHFFTLQNWSSVFVKQLLPISHTPALDNHHSTFYDFDYPQQVSGIVKVFFFLWLTSFT